MKKVLLSIALMLLFTACNGCGKGHGSGPGLLIIGDSISIGYTPHLRNLMPEYNVRRVNESPDLTKTENAQNTTYTMGRLDAWLAQSGGNSIITWNNGNWDARNDSYGTPIEQYRANLLTIGKKLTSTGAKVFFITTCDTLLNNPYYINGRAEIENQVAKEVLPALGITIIDLYSFQKGHEDWHISPDNVHFTEFGSMQLAKFISDQIRSSK